MVPVLVVACLNWLVIPPMFLTGRWFLPADHRPRKQRFLGEVGNRQQIYIALRFLCGSLCGEGLCRMRAGIAISSGFCRLCYSLDTGTPQARERHLRLLGKQMGILRGKRWADPSGCHYRPTLSTHRHQMGPSLRHPGSNTTIVYCPCDRVPLCGDNGQNLRCSKNVFPMPQNLTTLL